jgi:hypothetical protein
MNRPISVKFLVLFVTIAAVDNGLRLSQAIFFWKILNEYGANPIFIAISGGFWLLAAVFLAIGIWQRKTWAWAGTIGSVAVYGSWYWIDRQVLQAPHANWPFALVFTGLLAGYFALVLLNPKTRGYFNLR